MRVMIDDVNIPDNDDKMSTLIGALVISHMTMVMTLKMAIINDDDDKI